MMAWGIDCTSWDTSVDLANIDKFDYKDIPEKEFVITTWHSTDSLNEVFWFSKNVAFHSVVDPLNTLLLHISSENRERVTLVEYANA